MKFNLKYVWLVLTVVLLFAFSQCNTTSVGPVIQRYSYLNPIVNPPDSFQIVYNLSSYGDQIATVQFQDSSVWQIKILSDGRALFGIINPSSQQWNSIKYIDTIGFQSGLDYKFTANNNNVEDLQDYFVQFNKLSLDYNTYPKKY